MIKDFSNACVTHGTLNAKKSNVILMVTAVGGNHHRLDFMIGPGKALAAAWNGGNYTAAPEKGVRLWRDIVNLLAARTPDMVSDQFGNGPDVLPSMPAQEDAVSKAFDANDWSYQTWAYDKHDVGATPGSNGDAVEALRSKGAVEMVRLGRVRGRDPATRRMTEDDIATRTVEIHGMERCIASSEHMGSRVRPTRLDRPNVLEQASRRTQAEIVSGRRKSPPRDASQR